MNVAARYGDDVVYVAVHNVRAQDEDLRTPL